MLAYFHYGFRCSESTIYILTVVSGRITRVFNRYWPTRAVALDISKAFDRVWYAGLLSKPKPMEFQVKYLVLFLFFSVIDGFEWFCIESLHKNICLML